MKMNWSLLLVLFLSGIVRAQLSPGDLSRPHADLEGIKHCTECHEVGKKVSAQKCLACHVLLRERIAEKAGLHSQPGYDNCVTCHNEHHGRDFPLIHWKDGKENFDHSLTGFKLEGKHNGLKCAKCHQPEYISQIEQFRAQKKDLTKTFLGLRKDCLSCHRDEHRGQFKQACLDCHDMNGWKPAPKFDHAKTDYPLTGKHKTVDCQKCHKSITDNRYPDDPDFLRFAGVEFGNCSSCHEDIHHNTLGPNCRECHVTTGWKSYNEKAFNHSKTRFPLRGKHRTVACEKCHLPGKPVTITHYQHCADCHEDYHQGQFTKQSKKQPCEDCHTEDGFTPSKYTVLEHNKTEFPLDGSHLAFPCIACHKEVKIRNGSKPTMQFTFKSTRCNGCHQDPHGGELDRYTAQKGCEYCHSTLTWKAVSFDHSQTKFPLEGRHVKVECSQCHKLVTPPGHFQFKNVETDCQSCHKDIHFGQFATTTAGRAEPADHTQCSRCHTPSDWKAEKFNHNRDAKFKLEGAHQNVPCQKCHFKTTENGNTFVRFKPLDISCSSCHGNSQNPLQKGKI